MSQNTPARGLIEGRPNGDIDGDGAPISPGGGPCSPDGAARRKPDRVMTAGPSGASRRRPIWPWRRGVRTAGAVDGAAAANGHAPASPPSGGSLAPGGERCRVCGCSDPGACLGGDGLPCAWVEADLCTACAGLTATALVKRVDRLAMMARLADIGAAAEILPGEAPAQWALVARWPDGRASAVAGERLPAAAVARLLRDAADRAQRGASPGLDGFAP